MVKLSLSVTPKHLSKVIQIIFHDQKRTFQTSHIKKRNQKMIPMIKNNEASDKSQSDITDNPTMPARNPIKTSCRHYSLDPSAKTKVNNVGLGKREMSHRVRQVKAPRKSPFQAHFGTSRPTLQELPSDEMIKIIEEKMGEQREENQLRAHQRMSQTGIVEPSTMKQIYYFDTMVCVKKLEAKGFTREQAEVCVECLVDIINSTIDHQARHMVTKSQQNVSEQNLTSEIALVKKDMELLQKSEFSSLRSETEKIAIDINRIEGHFQDEIIKLKGQFRLDINLEHARAVEAHAESTKNLQLLHNKIDTQIANLKTTFEIYRNDVIKFAGGTVLTCATLILGFIRLWK